MFIIKGYLCDDLFKINIMTIVTNDKNKNMNASSFYVLGSCYVWHVMLGHVNYNTL
jgi:hypothetical protein